MPAPARHPAADPGQPIPCALTPKALALLAGLEDIPPGQWACRTCGSAYFGTAPGDGLCPDCRPPGAPVPARPPRRPCSPWVLPEDGITDDIARALAPAAEPAGAAA
jgi:hypothetical protein